MSEKFETKFSWTGDIKHVPCTWVSWRNICLLWLRKKEKISVLYSSIYVTYFCVFYTGQLKNIFSRNFLHTHKICRCTHELFFSEFLNIGKIYFSTRCTCHHVHRGIFQWPMVQVLSRDKLAANVNSTNWRIRERRTSSLNSEKKTVGVWIALTSWANRPSWLFNHL